jgi:hypothetical protein
VRERLLTPRPSASRWEWAAIAAVTAVAGLLRFWRLDRPHRLVFDETYYVKQGVSYLRSGYELAWNGNPTASVNARFADGDTNVFQDAPDRAVHPPVGKWMIAAGEWVFGPGSSWGWRFSAALVGTASILMVTLITRRLLRSTLLGVVAGLLLTVDGHHFVLSRTGLLDIFLMFWALAAFGCLVIDRDDGQTPPRRPHRRSGADGARPTSSAPASGSAGGGWRPASASGSPSAPSGPASTSSRLRRHDRPVGRRRPARRGRPPLVPRRGPARRAAWPRCSCSRRRSRLPRELDRLAALQRRLRPPVGHAAPRRGRAVAAHGPAQPVALPPDDVPVPRHAGDQAPVHGEPVVVDRDGPPDGVRLRLAEARRAGLRGRRVRAGDHRARQPGGVVGRHAGDSGAALPVGAAPRLAGGRHPVRILAGYVPWFLFQDRTIYTFYSVAFVPWLAMGLAYVLGMVLGPSDADERRRRRGAILSGAVVLAAVLLFWYFLPILSAEVIPRSAWQDRMWLISWI